MEPTPNKDAGARQQLLRNIRLGALLVVLLVGLLGGFRIWQLEFSRRDFALSVGAEPDVTATGTQAIFEIDELLRFFDFELRAPDGGILLEIGSPVEGVHVVSATGSERQEWLAKGRATGWFHHPEADDDRLRFAVGAPALVEGTDSLRLDITRQAADDLQFQRVQARMAVRNQHGDPVTGLRDRSGRLDEQTAGAYALQIEVQDLLVLLQSGSQGTFDLTAEVPDGEKRTEYRLAVPVRWFLSESDAPHVLQVEQLRERVVVRAQPASMRPRSVTTSGWNGELQVRGRDMDLVERAALVGGGARFEMQVVDRAADAILLRAAGRPPGPGRYALELHDAEGPLDFSSNLVVALEFRVTAPVEGATVVEGEALEVRWSAPASASTVEVQASSGGTEAWFDVYRGSASAGAATWATEGLDPGVYRLRVRLPERSDVLPVMRTVEIAPIPAVLVRLRFTRGGTPYGRISEILVDGEVAEIDASDPFLVGLRVEPGRHTLQLRGSGIAPIQRQILVEDDGQVLVLELDG